MTVRMVTHKFTVEDFYRMHKAGIFEEDDRVELIEGEIVEMAAIGSRHFAAVLGLSHILSREIGERASVSVQSPIQLSDRSMPQPDVTLLIHRADNYRGGLPGPTQVLLVVEVADSSLIYDQLTKLPLYASAGIREYWLVDLVQGRIEVHRQPSATGYAETIRVERGGTLTPLAFPDVNVRVEEVIG